MSGPYETERQAADAARHVYDSPAAAWRDGKHRLMEDACTAAGVRLGAYDHRILIWLTTWEPSTCAVVAGLITRAHEAARVSIGGRLAHLANRIDARLANERADRQLIAEDAAAQLRALANGTPAPALPLDDDQAATVLSALEDASDGIRDRAAYCPACQAHPADLCDETADQLRRAEAYDVLGARLREATS